MSLEKAIGQLNRHSEAIGIAQRIRENGYQYFADRGVPTKRDEDWKYTSLKTLEPAYLEPRKSSLTQDQIQKLLKGTLNSQFYNLVFVDGHFEAKLSQKPSGLEVLTLMDALGAPSFTKSIKPLVKARAEAKPVRQDALEALNSAFLQDGVILKVKKSTKISKPVQLVFLQTEQSSSYIKTYIHCREGSELSLIESFVGGGAQSFSNAVTEILLDSSARLEYLRNQNLAAGTIDVGCTRIFAYGKSELESLVSSVGAAISRHNFDYFALESYAKAQINGLTITAGDQHVDNHTNIEHVVGHCETQQLYKSILAGKSRAVFNGRVHIRANAQKASSDQLNKNLLLTSEAEADSKPQLEIYADDVKATHGSTVGQLNAEELFYFLSRGISREQAQEMLSLGFIQDLVERLPNQAVKKWMRQLLKSRYLAIREIL